MMNKSLKVLLLAVCGLVLFFIINKDSISQKKANYKHPYIKTPHGQDIPKEPAALPNEWMGHQRTYPYAKIKQENYLQAINEAQNLHQRNSSRELEWTAIGPENIGGRITDLAYDINEPSTIYVAAASGGIYKTINNGSSWEHIFKDSPIISIGDIALDPNNSQVLYAGTGEANASSYSFLGNGMWKSIDGGSNWEHIGLESSAYVGRIIIDYNNSDRVFVAACGTLFSSNSQRGVYRTLNGGQSWDRVLFLNDSTAAIDLVQHPTDPDILYAAMWERTRGLNYRKSGGESSGVWKTIDGGDSWIELENGLPYGDDVGRIGLDISISNPDILYAFYDQHIDADQDYSFLGIYKTENAGNSWSQTNDNSIRDMSSRFGWYFGQLRIDPSDPDRVYALGVDLVMTENGGDSWQAIAGYWNSNDIHVDHHAMIIDPNTSKILIGNDGGLYTSENYGSSWQHINNIPLTQFYAIEVDYQLPYRIYGGTQDNNTIRTLTGSIDDWSAILGGDGFYTIVDPENSDIIYAEYQWGNLFKSTDGGASMNNISDVWNDDRTNWSSPVIMDRENPSSLYFGTYRVWKTQNGGNNWLPISEDLTDGDDGSSYHTITTLALSMHDNEIVLAGTDDGNLHITQNGGGSWVNISSALPKRWITRVAFDPFENEKIYVTLSGFRWDEPLSHIFMSTDLGASWESVSSNLPEIPINCIALDSEREGHIYIGTDSGIFFTSNSGIEWVSYSYNMPRVPVIDLKIHNPTRKLIAGTYGLSAFSINLDQNLLGDINYDGILNVLDVVLLVNLVLGNEYSDSADLNLDSDLSILDIVLLINIIL